MYGLVISSVLRIPNLLDPVNEYYLYGDGSTPSSSPFLTIETLHLQGPESQ